MTQYFHLSDSIGATRKFPMRSNKSQKRSRVHSLPTRSSLSNGIRHVARPKKRLLVVSVLLLAFIQLQISSRTVSSIRRILCMNGESTPYIAATAADAKSAPAVTAMVDTMDIPKIPGRRNPPTHIILCEEFLRRQEMHKNGEPIIDAFHVDEDDAVCRDWSTPHLSLMEMFSSSIIAFVAQKYRMSYTHNCQRDEAPDETMDGLDWMTIQEIFPPSSLVLDDGSVSEEQVVGLCRGCISAFNQFQSEHPESENEKNPNPQWFNPHLTHHCILYPGTSRPLINEQDETDMVAMAERRAMAQDVPFAKVIDTIKDRLQLAAIEWKLEHDPADFMTEHDASGIQRTLFDHPVPPGSTIEEQNGAVIYLDEGALPLTNTQYGKFVPSTVETIDILVGPLCTSTIFESGETCVSHAGELEEYFEKMYPKAIVQLHVITSTAAAYSRMIQAKYLICPPGIPACLLPALAKEEDTFAVLAENHGRLNTYEYFNFVDTHDDKLQIAQVSKDNMLWKKSSDFKEIENQQELPPNAARVFTSEGGESNEADATSSELTEEGEAVSNPTSSTDESRTVNSDTLSAFTDNDYRDGCVELRGRLGSWELDYDFEDLKGEKNQQLRGQSNLDVDESRFIDGSQNARFGDWNDANPECALDMLNLKGLCEVVVMMELSTITFVGDRYTEEQVKSFWELLGLDSTTSGEEELQEGQVLHSYRKTAHCPDTKPPISFDILFTPNEGLVQTVEPTPIGHVDPEIRYVPVPAPAENSVTEIKKYYHETTNNNYHTSTTDTTNTVRDSRTNNNSDNRTARSYGYNGNANWHQQPYGFGGYGGGYGGWGGWGGYGGRSGPVGVAPTYNSGCCCVPFQHQYQFNAYGGGMGGAPMGGPPMPGMNPGPGMGGPAAPKNYYPTQQRQAIVAGLSPNLSYDEFTNQLDQFGRGITDYGNADDVVILRTGFETNEASTGGRRTNEDTSMSPEEIEKANAYMIKAVDEYRRRTKQIDLVSYDPAKADLPNIHILDVSYMTNTHPHSKNISHGRRNEQVASMYDHWNHLLYSNLRDIAAAEMERKKDKMKRLLDTAPEGSPYNSRAQSFTGRV